MIEKKNDNSQGSDLRASPLAGLATTTNSTVSKLKRFTGSTLHTCCEEIIIIILSACSHICYGDAIVELHIAGSLQKTLSISS